MSPSITLRVQAPADALFSSGKGKEEEDSVSAVEQDQAPIDMVSDDLLSLFFTYATNDCKDGTTLSAIRGTRRSWYNVLDTYNLGTCWGKLQKKVRNPSLRSVVAQIVFVDRFVSEVIASAIYPLDEKFEESEQPVLLNRIDPLDFSSFSRFAALTQELRKRGAPIPHEHAVIGLELSAYEKMQRHLDTALETIWMRTQEQIDFEGAPIPANAEAIRAWMNNPLNADKIALIAELDLSNMNLTVLPPEIGKLVQLTRLDLSQNRISALPPEIGKLTLLTWLNLSQNRISALPPEIGKLTLLTWLNLSTNQLTTFPLEIGTLSLLTELNLSQNRITVLPPQIGNFSLLRKLALYENWITTLPPEIGHLIQLTQLRLEKNRITALPPEIGTLSLLTGLYLSENRLTNLPSEIGNLSRLRDLSLPKNQISTLPPEIGNIFQLMALNLSTNKLATLPPEIANLSNLAGFFLDHNLLIFILDKDFRQLDAVENLDVQQIAGKLFTCSTYACHTPLASLCQQIHLGLEEDLLRRSFAELSEEMQQDIRQAWAAIPSSSSSSSEAGADLFADKASFATAVITALQDKWQSLSEAQRYQTYVQVSILAEQPEEDGAWDEALAEENIIRLIDAMELVTQE